MSVVEKTKETAVGVIKKLKLDVIWKLVYKLMFGFVLKGIAKVLRLVADVLDKKAEKNPTDIPEDADAVALMIADMVNKIGSEAFEKAVKVAEEKAKSEIAKIESENKSDGSA